MSLVIYPIKAQRQQQKFDLFEEFTRALIQNNLSLQNYDIIVISSKYISNSQGRLIDINKIQPSSDAKIIAKQYRLQPQLAELIIRESDKIFGGIYGFLITSADYIIAPNAGIDKSNINDGKVVLYPNNAYETAEQLRRKIFLKFSVNIGVIIADSRLMPARVGTTAIAIACAGVEPVLDRRAQKDLNGKPLKVTFQAVADNLASMANHMMGEGAESKPFAIIRNSGAKLTSRKIKPKEMTVPYDECVYFRGLRSNLF